MRLPVWFALPVLAVLGIAVETAAADDDFYVKLKALLPPASGAQACYARTYDAKHLAEHPKQKVSAIMLYLRYVLDAEEERALTGTSTSDPDAFRYDFTLAATFRNRPETVYASGQCSSTESIFCGVECDGGGVELEPHPAEHGALLVRLDRGSGFIRMTPGCGDELEDAVLLESGADDKVFKLKAAPVAQCAAMQAELDSDLEALYRGDD